MKKVNTDRQRDYYKAQIRLGNRKSCYLCPAKLSRNHFLTVVTVAREAITVHVLTIPVGEKISIIRFLDFLSGVLASELSVFVVGIFDVLNKCPVSKLHEGYFEEHVVILSHVQIMMKSPEAVHLSPNFHYTLAGGCWTQADLMTTKFPCFWKNPVSYPHSSCYIVE
ncbi:hypothetical protein AVEN_82485-1 [Araneus ventricosus]|uniref:Uncharacterized protein n=1 Tax=Araneus ventricosus TaxID=182803 RepID=A0A4Y2KW76_ARAVE|nr:hypothetical protein AVEN_82485-1 [Araneus ventricosus]